MMREATPAKGASNNNVQRCARGRLPRFFVLKGRSSIAWGFQPQERDVIPQLWFFVLKGRPSIAWGFNPRKTKRHPHCLFLSPERASVMRVSVALSGLQEKRRGERAGRHFLGLETPGD